MPGLQILLRNFLFTVTDFKADPEHQNHRQYRREEVRADIRIFSAYHGAVQQNAEDKAGGSQARQSHSLLRRLRGEDMALQRSKVTNLRWAAARLDGLTLRPGETLSFWRAVGKPTRRRGYVEGMILRNGRVASGVGGGLCQMTNLLYWMTLHTPLTVTERWRHGYDVFPDSNRTQPFGSGATCFYNYMDLMVRNDTPDTWRLVLQVTDTHLEGEWRADGPQTCRYEVYEKEHEIRGEYWGGFTRHNTLFRRVLGMDGAELGEEFITENHAIMMYNPMLEETAP